MIINYVEDEKDLADLITRYLVKEGYKVNYFATGEEAESHIADNCDMWILDIMLPGDISGFTLLRKIKEANKDRLVIFTSARDTDIDKVLGLENGSDDYIAKPFSPRELVLRVANLFKRTQKIITEKITYDNYIIDADKREVKDGDEVIFLTYKEYQLLEYFLTNKNREIARDDLQLAIWGDKEECDQNSRVVDDLLRRLRKKMPRLKISTIYGFGYRLV